MRFPFAPFPYRHVVECQGMQCGIVEGANVEDAVGYRCNSDAVAICFDCGTHLCDAHAGHCDLRNEAFCATCLECRKCGLYSDPTAKFCDNGGNLLASVPPPPPPPVSNMECPNCKLVNPPTAKRCDCSYDFTTGTMEQSYLTERDRQRSKPYITIVILGLITLALLALVLIGY